ncbi:interleukin-22 receptor subunit alpha-2 [Clupea harengus]|uniref:Interleukin-22 receptor subunit alpha-2 n=1 Tax=Clupea harengus TaxID=7950 RepID=A0A6P8GE36_CLUHA|nr:interleukin-22 receptor subunit alpha-2 [Clupea harengus]
MLTLSWAFQQTYPAEAADMSLSIPLLVLTNHFLLVWCAAVGLNQQDDAPVLELSFQSLDYRNILHWKLQPSTSDVVLFSVQYKIYGDKQWTDVRHCQNISQLQCDLSKETSDPREWYYARVQVSTNGEQSEWALSSRFHPQWESSFSPPQIRLNVTQQSIVVRVRPPRTPLRRADGRRIPVTKYQRLNFRIYLTHDNIEEEQHEIEDCTKELMILNLNPRTTFCLQAETLVARRGQVSPRGPKTCVTTL